MNKNQIKKLQQTLVATVQEHANRIKDLSRNQISPQSEILATVTWSNILLCEILLKLKEGETDA